MSNPLKIPCIVRNGLPSSLKPEDFKQMEAKATKSGFPVIFQEGEKAYRVLALASEGSFFLSADSNLPKGEFDGSKYLELHTINYLIKHPTRQTKEAPPKPSQESKAKAVQYFQEQEALKAAERLNALSTMISNSQIGVKADEIKRQEQQAEHQRQLETLKKTILAFQTR